MLAGLIALDVDGTVLLEDETPSPGVVDAVAAAVEAGHEVTLATGRSWGGTHRVIELLGIRPEFVVCANGAVIMRRGGDEFGYSRWRVETFDPSTVLGLLQAELPDAHYMVELADGHRLFTDEAVGWNLDGGEQVAFERLAAEPVSRIVVVDPGSSDADFLAMTERIGLHSVSYAIGWTAWLDIAPHGVDKSSALEIVRAELAVEGSDVLVMGDGRNDLGMFAWARDAGGRAVAMAQGPQEVRDAASAVTLSVEVGGVAEVLRAL
ncbi:haloacid dehalogenase [Microbacterium mangrovi]|uniref:Haloacid dehalogenase n=2 Tax=Microbacterium mangrovi TaxID=1348253 RepID=A0A0B2A807_9MICO|nr:HAD family hydrolase [Microbacterium mangrovi]KHK97873.1 haloacid dehalogenase [Microbacterium mangrovi]